MALAAAAAVAAVNAMACDYSMRFADPPEAAVAGTADPSMAPAVLRDASLCFAGGTCVQAVLVQGRLSPATVASVEARAAQVLGRLWVCFQSAGGDHSLVSTPALPPNVSTCVADVVDESGGKTKGLCASACAWLWLAGPERALFDRSTVEFHRPYIRDAALCTPGNLFTAAVSMAKNFLVDLGTYPEPMRNARQALRMQGMSKGIAEAYALGLRDARDMGLVGDATPERAELRLSPRTKP